MDEHAAKLPSLRVADAALAAGAPELALRVADLVLRDHPKNARALNARGDALYALGQERQAREAYRAALAIDPGDVGARVGLGRTLARSDPAASEAEFLVALEREPDNLVALNNLGVVRDLQGHNAEAATAYERALALAPGNPETEINLGVSLALAGRTSAASHVLRGVAEQSTMARPWRKELLAGLAMAGDDEWARRKFAEDDATMAAANLRDVRSPDAGISSIKTADATDGFHTARKLAAASDHRPPREVAPIVPRTIDVPDDLVASGPGVVRISVGTKPSGGQPAGVAAVAVRPAVLTSRTAASAVPMSEPSTAAVAFKPPNPSSEAGPYVQLASLVSEADAGSEWLRLRARIPGLIGDRKPAITLVGAEGNPWWVLRMFHFKSVSEANLLCDEVKAEGFDCFSRKGP